MNLLIFSYPEHFYISQLSAQAALKNLHGISKLTFLWDDIAFNHSNVRTNLYINRYKDKFDCDVVKFSQFPETTNESNGWLRQQYVKLQLHKIFSESSWVLLDGDTIINNKMFLDKETLFVTNEYYPPYFKFIEHCLNLKKQNDYSFICPLFVFEKEVLVELENYCKNLNNTDLIRSFKDYQYDKGSVPPFSEFEIYGTFATQVLKKSYKTVESNFTEFLDITEFLKELKSQKNNIILKGTDQDITNIENVFVK
jgi:hypothetical protein